MPDISIRINALIAYLFLGPILLLAKKGTPLAEPYVRGHAKKATFIILSGILAFFLYRFIKPNLSLVLFGFGFDIIVLSFIVSALLIALVIGGYRAFNGRSANELRWESLRIPERSLETGDYSEEYKIRIIASFIPFMGIIIASKFPTEEICIGRKIGTLFTVVLLTSIVFFGGSTTTLTLLFTMIYIGLVVTTSVYLFGFSRFLNFAFYKKIPTYLVLDAHIKSGIVWLYDFLRIAFGGKQKSPYSVYYSQFIEQNTVHAYPIIPYFSPLWIMAIPGINLITIPSLWQVQYKDYVPLILQGIGISILSVIIFYFYGISSQMALYLIFPILTIIMESGSNTLVRAPFTSVLLDLYLLYKRGETKITEIKNNGEDTVRFTYEVDKK